MRTARTIIALYLLLFNGLSFAQDNVQEKDQSRLETLVVTASRYQQPLYKVPSSVAVLEADSLQLLNPLHIQEALARVPGANFARGNGQEYLPALRSPVLSGAGACGSLLITVDAIPLRAAGFCNINEMFEAPVEMARRLEILRGPAGSLYGSNAMHGVVNIITAPVDAASRNAINLQAGPHDYSRSRISVNRGESGAGMRADISMSHDGGYRSESGFDQQKFTLRHEQNSGPWQITNVLSASNLNQETAGYIAGPEAYKNRELSESNPNPEAFRDASSARLASHIEYELGQGGSVSLTPYFRYTEMQFLQHFLPGTPLEKNAQRSFGLRANLQYEPASNLEFVGGIDAEITRDRLLEIQQNPTEGSPFLAATIPQGRHYDYRVAAQMLALYSRASWQPIEKLTLSAALRFEQMHYDYDNLMLAGRTTEAGDECAFGGCRFNRPADRSDSFDNWSPSLGLIYQYHSDQQLFVSLSHGFRAPQASELYRLQREQSAAELESEVVAGVEAGVRGAWRKIQYQLALYAMHKNNVIFRDADFFNLNDGKTGHRGLEFALEYPLAERWTLMVNTNYAEHYYRDNRVIDGSSLQGNSVDSAPQHFGSAQLMWRLNRDSRIELEWLHQGDYYTDPHNEHYYSGHELLNLRAHWQVNSHWGLQARISNLANAAYAERADYSNISGDRYFPGEPRSFYLGMNLSW